MQTILGAGGAIGPLLAKELRQYTDQVRLVGRNPKKIHEEDKLFSADLTDAALDTADSISGADFSGCQGLEPSRQALLSRGAQELDCWNPLTRSNTRSSLS